MVVEVSLKLSDSEWRYRIVFTQRIIGGHSAGNTSQPNMPVLKEEKVWKNNVIIVDRPTTEDNADELRMTQTVLEQINANKEFRDISDFFASVRYLHLVPQLVREPDRSVGRSFDPYGGDFLDQLAKAPKRTRESRLRKIQDALKIIVPQLTELKFEQDPKNGLPHLKGLYEHWRKNAGWQSEDQFSDGTLRLIGLLWSLQDGAGPLLMEEPELSLHNEVVRHLPQAMVKVMKKTNRQLFISTHSHEMLSDEGIAPEEILMLMPTAEGTQIKTGVQDPTLVAIVEAGGSVADIVLSKTSPIKNTQLDLFELL
ncbi:MAG TPA: ATP-binding protein [Paenibacillus sp.]|uniref:AAA family ATPase n=1 Tax=Paenibacillus sp. TaxID=58172 RepID=UPI002CCE9ED0|nr:ATP-binding protein [Paenibacillus sp.]HUC91269.1 ATP-binding protein [Paenibacillus sp.]